MRGATSPMSSFGAENILRQRLVSLGVPGDLFAILAGMSQSRLSRAMRGIQPFSNQEAQDYLKLSEELQALAHAIQPFGFTSADPKTINKLLDDFRTHSDREYWRQLHSALTSLRERVEVEENK